MKCILIVDGDGGLNSGVLSALGCLTLNEGLSSHLIPYLLSCLSSPGVLSTLESLLSTTADLPNIHHGEMNKTVKVVVEYAAASIENPQVDFNTCASIIRHIVRSLPQE